MLAQGSGAFHNTGGGVNKGYLALAFAGDSERAILTEGCSSDGWGLWQTVAGKQCGEALGFGVVLHCHQWGGTQVAPHDHTPRFVHGDAAQVVAIVAGKFGDDSCFCLGFRSDVDGKVALAFASVFHVEQMPVDSDEAAVGQCSQPLYVSAEFGTVHVIVAFFLKVRVEVPGGRQGHGGDVSCGGSADRDGSKGRCRRTRRKADHAQFLGAVGVCETENVLARYGGDFRGGINAGGGDGSGVYVLFV